MTDLKSSSASPEKHFNPADAVGVSLTALTTDKSTLVSVKFKAVLAAMRGIDFGDDIDTVMSTTVEVARELGMLSNTGIALDIQLISNDVFKNDPFLSCRAAIGTIVHGNAFGGATGQATAIGEILSLATLIQPSIDSIDDAQALHDTVRVVVESYMGATAEKFAQLHYKLLAELQETINAVIDSIDTDSLSDTDRSSDETRETVAAE